MQLSALKKKLASLSALNTYILPLFLNIYLSIPAVMKICCLATNRIGIPPTHPQHSKQVLLIIFF